MDSIVDYLLANHDKLLYSLAGISLVVELAVIGLSGPLVFFAIGCTFSGILVSAGIISGWEVEIFSVGIF